MIEKKEWVSADTMARYAGHDRVLGVITWLLVALVLLDISLLHVDHKTPVAVLFCSLGLVCYKAAARFLLRQGETKILLDLILLLLYAVAISWFTGKTSSPFISVLYLILMATSLTLGRGITFIMTGLTIALYTLLAAFDSPSFWYDIGGHVIKVFPFILIAHLGALLRGEAESARAEVERLSLTDDLTQLNNMRSFEALALQQEKISKRYGTPFSICMLDADNLKQINDRHGHLAGTELIKWTARIIASNIRESDVAARFGGDEFIIMFAGQEQQKIVGAVERIVRAMSITPFSFEGGLVLGTLSAGVASFPRDGEDLRTVVKKADQAMYRSKRLGKNRVSLFDDEEGETVPLELQVGGEKLRGSVPQFDGQRPPIHLGECDLPG